MGQQRVTQEKLFLETLNTEGPEGLRKLYRKWFWLGNDKINRIESGGLMSKIVIPQHMFSSEEIAASGISD